MSKVSQFRPESPDARAPSEYQPDGVGTELPPVASFRDDPGRLSKVMAATDLGELRAEMEVEIRATIEEERRQADAFAAEGHSSAQKTIAARGRLRAMGIQGVVEARKLEGRNDEPWTDFDADVAYGAADLFLTACGLGDKARARPAATAVIAKPSGRTLDPSIEAGIAASAAAEVVRGAEEDQAGPSA